MKVLVNGGLNLSELDGWWAEAYTPEVGGRWADGREHGDDPAWDAAEAGALYDLLEREVIPEFYRRDASGIPTAWIKRMRASMAELTPRFSASRTVREYTEQHYLPAATAYHLRIANQGAMGRQMVDWQHSLEQKWATVRFGEVKAETRCEQHVFEVQVHLNDLDPKAVAGGAIRRWRHGRRSGAAGDEARSPTLRRAGRLSFTARLCPRPAHRRTIRARVIPHFDGVAVPLGRCTNPVAAMIRIDERMDDEERARDHLPVSRCRRRPASPTGGSPLPANGRLRTSSWTWPRWRIVTT